MPRGYSAFSILFPPQMVKRGNAWYDNMLYWEEAERVWWLAGCGLDAARKNRRSNMPWCMQRNHRTDAFTSSSIKLVPHAVRTCSLPLWHHSTDKSIENGFMFTRILHTLGEMKQGRRNPEPAKTGLPFAQTSKQPSAGSFHSGKNVATTLFCWPKGILLVWSSCSSLLGLDLGGGIRAEFEATPPVTRTKFESSGTFR